MFIVSSEIRDGVALYVLVLYSKNPFRKKNFLQVLNVVATFLSRQTMFL